MINVTKTFLPPLDEYVDQLKKIWESGQVTNNGALLKDLELGLRDYLKVKHVFFTANGTLALQIAIRALGIRKKVITTPFSYVATTGSLLWEYCTPVFVDINSYNYCIDPNLIEDAIDEDTEAILAVHVYGYSCDVEALEKIASKYGLKVIYDAAHAFGVELDGKPLAFYGDISALSFHATKLFHTVEGGAVVTNDDALAEKIRLYRAFGHIGDEYFTLGINAKNSELHAAMGLCMLPQITDIIRQQKFLSENYDELLNGLPLTRPHSIQNHFEYNYAYYPVLFPNEGALLAAKRALEQENIYPRRYFFPPLNRLPYRYAEPCPVAEGISPRILCLPLYYQLTEEIQVRVVKAIASCWT